MKLVEAWQVALDHWHFESKKYDLVSQQSLDNYCPTHNLSKENSDSENYENIYVPNVMKKEWLIVKKYAFFKNNELNTCINLGF